MNLYATLGLLAAVALLQTSLAPYFSLAGVKPDLMLTVVVLWSLLRGAGEGMIWAFIGGALLDLFSGGPFGLSILSLMLISYLSGIGEVNIFRAHILLLGAAIVGATLLYYGFSLMALRFMGWNIVWGLELARVVALAVVINAILVLVIYRPLRWLHRVTGREEISW